MIMLLVSRRMATAFFFVIFLMKSLSFLISMPLAGFSSPMLSFGEQQQQQKQPDCQQQQQVLSPPRINMTLRRGYAMQSVYLHPTHRCGLPHHENNSTQRHMHPAMKNASGLLDFTTFLSTDLKIVVMGDSVGIQLSQGVEEMLGGKPETRKVYRYSWRGSEGIHISAPIRGGGVIAGMRILGMFLRKNLNKRMPNGGPGWKMEDVNNLMHHTYRYNTSSNTSSGGYDNYTHGGQELEVARQVGSFDVLLFHIPIGWIRNHDEINNNTLKETVLLAGELFGVKTVVFTVPSFSNNVMNAQELQSLRAVQQRVVQFANDYAPSNNNSDNNSSTTTATVRRVLTLRMDRLIDETMEWNAKLMGMNTVTTTGNNTNTAAAAAAAAISGEVYNDENDWRHVPLQINKRKKFTNHVAQVCSALPSPDKPTECRPNHLSLDGMHICMETMSGRIFAGLGCVLGCVYNNNNEEEEEDPSRRQQECQSPPTKASAPDDPEKVLNCADTCNDRYLSLTSVEREVRAGLRKR